MSDFAYLDLLNRKLDPSQKRVCCRTENTIVAAGAGSGKTQVLATRFAWLVMSCGIPALKILTLTFTKKAAAEMYSRIYATLNYFAGNEQVPGKERERAKQAVADFSQVHIQTLDSYCSSVVRQVANRYGIKPDFGEDGTADDIELKAFRFILENRRNPAVEFFMTADIDLQSFSKEYFADVVQNYSSIADDENFFRNSFIRQKEGIAEGWNENMKFLQDCIRQLNGAIDSAGADGADEFFNKLKEILEKVPELNPINGGSEIGNEKTDAAVKEVVEWLYELTALKTSRRKPSFTEAKEVLNSVRGNGEINAIGAFISGCSHYEEYFNLLDRFARECRRSKRVSGNLTFKDIVELSLKILIEQKDIRTQEKNAYSKIMIDEFQDNNSLNRDLLFLLSERYDVFTEITDTAPDAVQKALTGRLEKEKLFFVGDEKQSIYKFRGADVSVFNQLQDDLNVEPLHMVYNYRSNPSLLSTFNLMFGGWNSRQEDKGDGITSIFRHESSRKFEAVYPEKAIAKKVNTQTYEEEKNFEIDSRSVKGHICFVNKALITDKTLQLDYDNQEAFFTARKILQLYNSTPEEKRRWKDFAILDVSTTKRSNIINWLNRFGIPFSLDSQRDIFQEAPVNDIYSFLRLCVFPSDTHAFAAVLASPFANISEGGLLDVLCAMQEHEDSAAFAAEYEGKVLSVLSESDGEKYRAASSFFNTMRPKVLSQSLALTVSQLWNDAGYRYELILNTNVNLLAEQFDLLFELARRTDAAGKNCSWFVEQLELAKSSESELKVKDVNYPVEKGDAVQIMTIHKSKGLQFKHVFIFGLLKAHKNESAGCNYYSSEYGFTVAPLYGENYFALKERAIEKEKELAEFSRLIYVAVTRAEEDFYLPGSWEPLKETSSREIEIFEKVISFYYDSLRSIDEGQQDQVYYEEGAPFDFYTVPVMTKSQAYREASAVAEASRSVLIDSAERIFSENQPLVFEEPVSYRRTPSSLETEGQRIACEEKDLYPETNALIKTQSSEDVSEMDEDDLSEEEFSHGSFGTLAHAWLEQFILKGSTDDITVPVKLYKNLSESEVKKINAVCGKICGQFAETEAGQRALGNAAEGKFVKAEWSFYYYRNELLYRGSMDLIYECGDGTYEIIDYKTDESLNVLKYAEQQRCYRDAAAELLKTEPDKIKCKLYFIRFNKFMEVEFTPEK